LEVGDSRAVVPLVEALKYDAYQIRKIAADALGKLKDVNAMEPLIEALTDQDNAVRSAAADALRQMNDTEAKAALYKFQIIYAIN
jgi:HEAT repeat protein